MRKPDLPRVANAPRVVGDRTPILRAMFSPKSVAVIGATEASQSVGRTLIENLKWFNGGLYAVNPKRNSVLGLKAFPRIGEVPGPVDLAIIAAPALAVPDVVSECAEAGVKGAVIISAGFRECGAVGVQLEEAILARRGKMRLIGPNCLGVMIPGRGLNATFAKKMALPGNVAFISQSGALCTAVLDWSLRAKVGFSSFLSIGSMLDLGWGDLIFHLADDLDTRSILIYMESIGDARSFLSAAREVALTKPIIVIKVGRTEAAAHAVASHTGTLTGSDDVLDAAFRRIGVLRVETISDLFNMAEVLSKQPRPKGPRLAIVTNAGGPGVLATDMLVGEGGELAGLSEETFRRLDALLPAHWSRNDPVDVLGDAKADRFAKAVEIVSSDRSNDGVLVILTPQAMTDATAVAKELQAFKKLPGKPILASWMGADEVAAGEAILNESGIPTFPYPDIAARTFCYMWRYTRNLQALYETPALTAGPSAKAANHCRAEEIIQSARKAKRTVLTEMESKHVLEDYGIPAVETHVATSEDEAVRIAAQIGRTVVLKLYSEIIAHKTDVGGVKLNLQTENEVRQAYRSIKESVRENPDAFLGVTVEPMIELNGYELILGSSLDPQFGPVLLFGAGGQLVEITRDYALGLPPLNGTLARRLMEQTRVYAALNGVRGRVPVNLTELENLLVNFSFLVAEQRRIKEIDVNPLLASPEKILALDARIILHDPAVSEQSLPQLAIRPYPQQFVSKWELRDGTPLTIRPICPEDEPLMVKFHRTLSEESVYFRYFGILKLEQRIAHERLTRICFNDYDREIAIVATKPASATSGEEILAVGRLIKVRGVNEAEFAIVISDQWQGYGLGTHLLELLVEIGRQEGLERIVGHILPDNYTMQKVSKKVGFALRYESFTEDLRAEITL
jgi:acetyltransferase